MLTKTPGKPPASAASGSKCQPVIGTKLIDSRPPATTTSAIPDATAPLAIASAWSPDAQKRFTVIADELTGRPAASAGNGLADRGRGELRRRRLAEGALRRLRDRRPGGADDHGISHGGHPS